MAEAADEGFHAESMGPNQAGIAAQLAQPTLIASDPGRLRAKPHAGLGGVKGGLTPGYGHPSALKPTSSAPANEAGSAIWADANVMELTEQL